MSHPTPARSGRALWAAGLLAACLLAAPPAWAARVALLVGVSHYPKLPPNSQLHGPVHDLAALRDVLQRRWGFAASDIRVLVNADASLAAILRELAALQDRSRAGDEILIYFSGHGTSALDAGNAALAVPQGSGAFLPADFDPASRLPDKGLLIGRKHLRPVIDALEAGGRRLWVISDSCFSGQQVRSLAGESQSLPARWVPLQFDQDAQAQAANLALAARTAPPEPYPYRATAYLAAAAEGEVARDIPQEALRAMPTRDGKPHGAFTDALLRVLEGELPADADGDGLLSLAEAHRSVADFMARRSYGHTVQRLPAVAEDQAGLGLRPVLSQRQAARAPARTAAPPPPLKLYVAGSLAPRKVDLQGLPDLQLDAPLASADLLIAPATAGPGRGIVLRSAAGDVLAQADAGNLSPLRGPLRQLAYAQRLQALAEAGRRGVLPAEIEPAVFGGNFILGQTLRFAVRPDRPATLLLLNLDAQGQVSVLYPAHPSEMQALPAGQLRRIPGDGPQQALRVQPPLGMDIQHLFAFDEAPPGLDRLRNASGLQVEDARLIALETTLREWRGRYTHTRTELRTLAPPALP